MKLISFFLLTMLFIEMNQHVSAQSLIQNAYNNRRSQKPEQQSQSQTKLVNQKKFCHYTDAGKITYCYFFEKDCAEKLDEEKNGSCKEEILGGTGQVVGQ